MYSFGHNMFISFLEDNPKIKEQYDKYINIKMFQTEQLIPFHGLRL